MVTEHFKGRAERGGREEGRKGEEREGGFSRDKGRIMGEIEHPEARYGFMTYYLSDPGRHELSSTHAANAHVALPYPRFVLHHVKQTDGVIRRVLSATSASVDDVSRR